MDIWAFQRKVTRRLLSWSILSIVLGFPMWLDSYRPIKNLGMQFLTWGGIDAMIALFGQRSSEKRQAKLDDPYAPDVVANETKKLRRILWLNTFLDVGYMAGGGWMLAQDEETRRGHGVGVLIQGGFLFFFDLWHALRLRK